MQPYERKHVAEIRKRLSEPRSTIVAITGPRQVGKTTMVRQALEGAIAPVLYKSADGLVLSGSSGWLGDAWAEIRAKADQANGTAVLVLDEIQKIPNWSDEIKRYWDEDTWAGRDIRVVVLGSSVMLLNHGLRESLAGRFERVRAMPWSYAEMRDAFGWDLATYAVYGGYPGAAPFVTDPSRWMAYMRDSIIEPVLLKDLLQQQRIDKPGLLHELLRTGARLSGREISYTKLMASLPDAGNTGTLINYLALLEEAGLLCGLHKYTRAIMQKRSSPKIQVFANGIATACASGWHEGMNAEQRGRCYESMVGAHLRSAVEGSEYQLRWWRDGNDEVDYVLQRPTVTIAVEIATAPGHSRKGLEAFARSFPDARTLMVGGDGIPFDVFLDMPLGSIA